MDRDQEVSSFSVKQHVIERWVQRRLGRIDHERRVVGIAETLFQLTRDLHELGFAELRLLRLGSLVHDVGRRISDKRHPEIGANMLATDRFLPLNDSERRALAYFTRYHRGAVPELGFDGILEAGDGRKRLQVLIALLRAADSLDNRQLSPPRLVFAMRGRRLEIICYLDDVSPKARRVYRRRKKFRLLEELLDCKVDVYIEQADAVKAVA